MPPPSGYLITPSASQPTRSANDTAEFRRNYNAEEFVGGLYALDNGYTGKGVTVAVIDDGLMNVSGELAGRISPLSKDFGNVSREGQTIPRNAIGDAYADHGTQVANIIGAAANGSGSVGYAPEVTIVALRVSDVDETTREETLTHSIEALDYATKNRFKLVNRSLSGGGSSVYAAALTRFAATGGLVVNSAANDGAANPDDASAVNSSNRAAIIFVGALGTSITGEYTLAGYSNKAGTMKDRYVVAPGTNVTTRVDGTFGSFSGTSSSAPVVTGLAATILSKWPQLSGQQAGDIILTTAKDIGAAGVDEVFGHGLVDFKAALAPVNPTLSNGTTQNAVSDSTMAVPSAMGATAIQNALSSVTVLDEYGRDFSGSIAGLVIRPEDKQSHWLLRRLLQMGQGGTTRISGFGLSGDLGYASYRAGPGQGQVRSALTAGSIAYTAGRTSFHAGWNAADSLQSDVMGLAPFADGILAYAPQAAQSFGADRAMAGGKLGLTMAFGGYAGTRASAATLSWSKGHTQLRASWIDEDGSVMGMPTGSGALSLGRGATTAMVEAHRTFDLAGGWSLEGYGSLGITRLKIDSASLVTGAGAIVGTRLGLQASGPALGGVLSLGVAQPLTVESGSARLTYGSGYDLASQTLLFSNTRASLAGERRVQLTAGFTKGGARSSLRLGVMKDLSDKAARALAGWSLRF